MSSFIDEPGSILLLILAMLVVSSLIATTGILFPPINNPSPVMFILLLIFVMAIFTGGIFFLSWAVRLFGPHNPPFFNKKDYIEMMEAKGFHFRRKDRDSE